MKNTLQRTKLSLLALALSLPLLAALPAHAHDDATLDAMATPHGGQLRMAGPLHLELVLAKEASSAKDSPVLVYLTDHAGTAVPAKGATGTLTLLSGKDKVSVSLTPSGDNLLKASARYTARPDVKAVLTVTVPGQEPVQARFTPLAPRAPAAAPAAHQH